MQIEKELKFIINRLQNAVNVCDNVDSSLDDYEKTYPFATGYSKSAMRDTITDLEKIVRQLYTIESEEVSHWDCH